ncbi:hypothetical protein D1AOALGA4SA_8002 [Olavius algarvensis Delta 1 endosymbiont]|nr:hypothetical protein D1AOALGA4SA_8002 [Olavius algarvensis Delta 1 endosymbiont]
MPLAFDSLSHGQIAFGFFNIESDMLLCDHYFIFADRFCNYVQDLAEKADQPTIRTAWEIQIIQTPEAIGDLMGAIHGIRFTGFIGELYRRFPFPSEAQNFKQNPQGFKTQSQVAEIIGKYATLREIQVSVKNSDAEIQVGEYRFSSTQFQELIDYVWRGGYPRWKDNIRPAYVSGMRAKILRNCQGIFEGIRTHALAQTELGNT